MSQSSPIRLTWKETGLAVVSMEDREAKNTFSPAFTQGLQKAFQSIAENKEARAVVIHGYDNYFSCGATYDQLIRLSENQLQYPDIMDFRLLLRCELPVIAAMQGHAIGGGFVFGCYADIIILAEECVYNTNFMHYGFTPGMGATLIIPDKLGHVLGAEMLLTGRNYRGAELQQRGAQLQIMKKANVIPAALTQAANLAEKPAASLRQLKRRLTARLDTALPAAVEAELDMQALTFSLPDVRKKIDALYRL